MSKHNKKATVEESAEVLKAAAEDKVEATEAKVGKEKPVEAKPEGDKSAKRSTWVLHPHHGWSAVIHVVLDILVPYGYIFLCGLVFDRWLRLYEAVTFIFISWVVLQLAGIVFAILNVVNYSRFKKYGTAGKPKKAKA